MITHRAERGPAGKGDSDVGFGPAASHSVGTRRMGPGYPLILLAGDRVQMFPAPYIG